MLVIFSRIVKKYLSNKKLVKFKEEIWIIGKDCNYTVLRIVIHID